MRGIVFNMQRYSIHDGPGTRTLVFLKGCPLRCGWCSNPESQSPRPEILFEPERCSACGACVPACPEELHSLRAGPSGTAHLVDRAASCRGCGACADECPNGALRVSGRSMSVGEVVDAVMRDAPFYWQSGGGVTLSGGEATMQAAFAREVLMACRGDGVHTALETCGMADWETFRELAPHVDLFLYDIKHMDDEANRRLTGAGNRRILDNLRGLFRMGKKVLIRMPLIPGLNDDPAGLEAAFAMLREEAARGADIAGVELLPYHRYGEGKYRQLGRAYPCGAEPYTEERLEAFKAFLAARSTEGVPLRLVRHA